MKPVRLTMQAFGSYGKKTVIDFTVPNQNLFLITGDTGAGKTTIFDAMVFAIYGQASSVMNRKEGTELQSQYADPQAEPFVEFVFLEKEGEREAEYTVRRIPKHIRPKQRGKGMVDVSASLTLWMPDGTEYPQKEAQKKIEEIVGLTREQFMQIAMIAQGEFMELLRAKSEDKKPIFRKLFHTDRYQQIVEDLGERKREKEKNLGILKTFCQAEIGHLVLPALEDPQKTLKNQGAEVSETQGNLQEAEKEQRENLQRLRELKEKILKSDQLSIVDLEELMERLEGMNGWLSDKKKEAELAWKMAEEERNRAETAWVQGEETEKRFVQYEQVKTEKERQDQRLKEDAEKEEKGAEILAAWEIKNAWEQYEEVLKRKETIEKSMEKLQRLLPGLKENLELAERKLTESKTRWQSEANTFAKTEEQVHQALKILEELSENRTKEKNCQTQNKELEEKEALLLKQQEEQKKETEQWKEVQEATAQAEVLAEQWKLKREIYENRKKDAMLLETLEIECLQGKEKLEEQRKCYEKAREQYLIKNQQFLEIQSRFFDAQAGILAKEKLIPGSPCPVCGSLTHPSPCILEPEEEELTREQVKQYQDQVQEAQKKMAKESEKAAKLESHQQAKEAERLLKQEELRNQGVFYTAGKGKEWLKEEAQKLNEERKNIREQLQSARQAKQKLKELEEEKERQETEQKTLAEERVRLKTEYEKVRERIEELEKENIFESRESALKHLSLQKRKTEMAREQYEKQEKTEKQLRSEKEEKETLLKEFENRLPLEKERSTELQKRYEEMLTASGKSEKTWKNLTGMYTRIQGTEYQKEAREAAKTASALEAALKTAKESLEGKKRPDRDALLEQKEIQTKKAQLSGEDFQTLRRMYETDQTVYHTLNPKLAERQELLKELQAVSHLYLTLAGKVSGARMDIETYVQRYYLEQILYSANEKFYQMSAGQYELRLCDLEKAGIGKNRGLDLMVYSNVTGKEREIRTLSGGESFMAALSLALGMADQIQESSAAINLDILFIDEGFGSLDEHSRNQAVKVLQQLAGGSKLIGIISHVSELKQEIEDQLIVEKTESGSNVRWQIS